MLKILITIALVLILTTSIYSQVDARFGGFRGGGFGGFGGGGGGGFGGLKSFNSHSVPLGTGQGKTFTSSPSGKISSPPETTQSASSSSFGSGGGRNPQSNFQNPGSQSQFQQQPHSNFFGGGFGGGGFGGFGSMLMSSIMGNFIGQALFGWMFPHPAPVATPAPAAPTPTAVHAPVQKVSNNTSTNNNFSSKFPNHDQQFSSPIKK